MSRIVVNDICVAVGLDLIFILVYCEFSVVIMHFLLTLEQHVKLKYDTCVFLILQSTT